MKQIYYGLFVLTLLVCVSCQKNAPVGVDVGGEF